jgi:hypothetical protein
MSGILKVITVVAQLCLLPAAANCQSRPELCIEDETSLIQLQNSLSIAKQNPVGYTFDTSPVEVAQDDVKAAQNDRTIQMYAQSTARLEEAKAIHAAVKAHMNSEHATLDEINAERAAADAVQAAQDEADAWAASVQTMKGADNKSAIAEADWSAKHSITKMAAAAAADATKSRTAAEADAHVAQITEQDAVNDAQAEAAANYSFQSKLAASARVAQQKGAYAVWKEKRKVARDAQKQAWKSKQKARQDEWKAHLLAEKSQKFALKAAKQGVRDIVNGYASQPYAAPASLLEDGPTVLTDPSVTAAIANATSATSAVEYNVDEAVSDEKRAKAIYDTAKYAEFVAANKRKRAQMKVDNLYLKEAHIQQQARKLAKRSREAVEQAKALAWQLKHKNADNASAWNRTLVAENITYQTADAVRKTTDLQAQAQAKLTDAVEYTKYFNANATANATALEAQQDAENAMVSRISADYDSAYADGAKYNFTVAKDNLTLAGQLKHDAVSASYRASNDAHHAAGQAQKYDRLAAAANIAGQDFVETTETVSTVSVPGL